MKVSVIVVNWNRRDLLRACLKSLANQTQIDFEVIVVENGSVDGSGEMIAREFPAVRLIRNRENRGFCAANNQGIQASKAEFIALLNNDAEADPGWLAALVDSFQGRADFGMAASKILVWENPQRIDKAGHLIYPDGQNRGRGSGETDIGQYDHLEEALWPDGCAAMYRREMLDSIGGFDEDLFAYADDAELGLDIRPRFRASIGANRAQPSVAGRQIISLESAVVKRAVFFCKSRYRHLGGGSRTRRGVALSRRAG